VVGVSFCNGVAILYGMGIAVVELRARRSARHAVGILLSVLYMPSMITG
jgi:hypothetical protein